MIRGRALRAFPRVCLAFTVLAMLTPVVPASALSPPAPTVSADAEVSIQAGSLVTGFDYAAGDHFGMAVATSENYVVIGAPDEDTGGLSSGCAYVYVREWAGWDWDDNLYAPDAMAGALFGGAVAVYGDTIVIGADGDTALRGAAYVFRRAGGSWGFPQKIVPPGSIGNHHVGIAVDVYQDTLLIGSWAGVAWTYVWSGSTWALQGTLTDPGGAGGDFFGYRVGLHQNTAVVSADQDDNKGSACVFVRTGTAWSFQQKLWAADGAVNDHFGLAVAVDRDTVMVGAPYDDDTYPGSGSVYVFTRTGTTWAQTQKVHATTVIADASFGNALALSGDTALVGAPSASTPTLPNVGMVCLLRKLSGTWTEPGSSLGGPAAGDRLGTSVAIAGGRIAIGIPMSDEVAADAGAAFLLMGEGTHPLGITRIAGSGRYLTAVAASQQQFPAGASTVVVATGENWPDALGGSALCGAVYGPMLLTPKASLPADVTAEIKRLGATRAYVLGGTGAASVAVENQLVSLLGRPDVIRLSGTNRYGTALAIAAEVIRLDGDWDGHVLVATGADFPDATALAPVAAHGVIPIVLADPRASAVTLPGGTTAASIAGGASAVSVATESMLKSALGAANVHRYAGTNRYETAAIIAQTGVDSSSPGHELMWEGVGLASGTAFPDALSGGVMLGLSSSVLLLTPPASLSPYAKAKIQTNIAAVNQRIRIIGGLDGRGDAGEDGGWHHTVAAAAVPFG